MNEAKVKLGSGGRIVIPAQYRKALHLKPGDELVISLRDGEVRLSTRREAIKRAQARISRQLPTDRDLAEELIQERRQEAARE